MTHSHSFKPLLLLWLLILTTGGCATDGGTKAPAHDASTTAPSVGQDGDSNADLAFKYRGQAADLRNEARRLEIEAEFYSQHPEDQHLAKRNLELARKMRKAADGADDKARDYRAQVPHNQVN